MLLSLEQIQDHEPFDVVVLGAGGAGLSAALYAAIAAEKVADTKAGAASATGSTFNSATGSFNPRTGSAFKVLLVESTEYVGGTTAYSAATTWIPGTHLAAGVNRQDNLENAARFLDNAVGDFSDPSVRQALLDNGAAAVACIEQHTHLKYRARPFHPDYSSDVPGATTCGRALEPLPFDGRLLGDGFKLVRPPMPEFLVLKGMMVDRDDIPHLLGFKKSFKSLLYVLRILARHAADRLRWPRGTRLLMGNALVARLLHSIQERQDIALLMQTEAVHLQRNDAGRVDKIVLRQRGQDPQTRVPRTVTRTVTRTLSVRGGVILATGGFNRHPHKRAALLPGVALDWCPGAPGHTGTAHDLAQSIGAAYGKRGLNDAFWAPVSIRKRADGSTAAFPHFVFDRAKPGMVTVNQAGQRFLNESTSYHLFGIQMQQANQKTPCIPAYLITDAHGLHKYGLGMVRPRGMGLASALKDGYIVRGQTLAELAGKLGIPAPNLAQTVATLNRYAQTGTDPDFHRGQTLYQRANGDATHPGPNPSLGAIQTAPFYAVRLYPGDIGAATGFATDTQARVLDAQGKVIDGLYAAGNDMHSVMGGVYPAPGITIGPGLVFAYLAANHAVQNLQPPNQATKSAPHRNEQNEQENFQGNLP